MNRFTHAPRALAAVFLLTVFAPLTAPDTATAASGCGTYASETVPPPTIRVYRTATGAVQTVDFRSYVKNVLSREWISSWKTGGTAGQCPATTMAVPGSSTNAAMIVAR